MVTTAAEDMVRDTEYRDIALWRRELEESAPTPPYDDFPPIDDDDWRRWDDGWRGLTLFQIISLLALSNILGVILGLLV